MALNAHSSDADGLPIRGVGSGPASSSILGRRKLLAYLGAALIGAASHLFFPEAAVADISGCSGSECSCCSGSSACNGWPACAGCGGGSCWNSCQFIGSYYWTIRCCDYCYEYAPGYYAWCVCRGLLYPYC
jgi:hypothetical protein